MHSEKIENLEVYKVVGPTGEITFEAPLLNAYPLITIGTDGATTVLSNVELREPPDELFVLPAGVVPQVIDKGIPMGIRMSKSPVSEAPHTPRQR